MRSSILLSMLIWGSVLAISNAFDPLPPFGGPCENLKPGDCDPDACNGEESSCEAKYTRFWDPIAKRDRTRKSCQCAEESVCSVIGMHSFSGCRSYMSLSAHGQRYIREWTMSVNERQKRRQYYQTSQANQTFSPLAFDRMRHAQLQNGNSRFCCKTSKKRRRFVAASQTSGLQNSYWFDTVLFLYSVIVVAFVRV